VEQFDVAVIGGGLIGCSIAFELAADKLKVIVLDRQKPGCEASWAAAGMLSPAPDSSQDIPLVPLSRESLRIYPEFVRAIEQVSGKQTGYTRNGTLQIFGKPCGKSERDQMVAEHRRLGLAAEPVSFEAARAAEASIGPGASAVALLPEEGNVEPRLLMDAVLRAAARRGVEIRANCPVTSLMQGRDRCVGVYAGEEIRAKHVVLAAGCFSGKIGRDINASKGLLPTRPVRGQMLALRREGFRLQRVLRSERGYLVPRADGRVVAGSTTEDAGFEKKVTAAGMLQILAVALELCPALGGAEIVEAWSGLRPGTPDALPILGPTKMEGLIAATGHYRNGILLAPVTARLVRQWIIAGKPNFDVTPFSPLRFDCDPQNIDSVGAPAKQENSGPKSLSASNPSPLD
jgi:glycine oxidase